MDLHKYVPMPTKLAKNLALTLAFVICTLSCCMAKVTLPTQKSYPPYPDVWGYDVSDFPAMKWGKASVEAYRMPDGDIWLIISYSNKYKDPMEGSLGGYAERKYMLLKFFKGEQIELSFEERCNLELGQSISPLEKTVRFTDGTIIEEGNDGGSNRCLSPDFLYDYVIKKETNNHTKEYLILGVYAQVKVWFDSNDCDYKGLPFFYQRLFLLDSLIQLEDDTFIAYASNSNLMIRFDKDFNTQFEVINPATSHQGNIASRNFFVIERTVLDELKAKVVKNEMPRNQGMHDELLLYLGEKYK